MRLKPGARAVVLDPLRVARRYWSPELRALVGDGNRPVPREALDRPALVAHVFGARVLLRWPELDGAPSLWLDRDLVGAAAPEIPGQSALFDTRPSSAPAADSSPWLPRGPQGELV